jgi:hypothetical protein
MKIRQRHLKAFATHLNSAGLPVPTTPGELVGATPGVGVFIVPHDGVGALEDLCLRGVANDPAMSCVDAFFDCLRPVVPPARHIGKAKVQAFHASRQEEGKRLGEAAEAGYWPWTAAPFDVLKDFIDRMANT